MHRYQRLVDRAEVRELKDPITGGIIHVARYSLDNTPRPNFAHFLPLGASLSHADRAAQASALCLELEMDGIQIVHQGFKGSSMKAPHIRSAWNGNFYPQARSISRTLAKHIPAEVFELRKALGVGESMGAATMVHLHELGAMAVQEMSNVAWQPSKERREALIMQRKEKSDDRKAIVMPAIEGLEIPGKFQPTGFGLRRLPLHPFVPFIMFSSQFGNDCAFQALSADYENGRQPIVDAVIADDSIFPVGDVLPNYERLAEVAPDGFMHFEVLENVDHYLFTADPEQYAKLVVQQAARIEKIGSINF